MRHNTVLGHTWQLGCYRFNIWCQRLSCCTLCVLRYSLATVLFLCFAAPWLKNCDHTRVSANADVLQNGRRKFRGRQVIKSRGGKSQRREEKRRVEERRSEKRKSQKKEDAGARKGRKGVLCFPIICGSGKSKSRLAKAAGAEPSAQMRDEKLHTVVARSTSRSQKMHKTPHARSTFRS